MSNHRDLQGDPVVFLVRIMLLAVVVYVGSNVIRSATDAFHDMVHGGPATSASFAQR